MLSRKWVQPVYRSAAIGLLVTGASQPSQALDGDELSLRQAIAQANRAIQGEVTKAVLAQKAVLEGLAAYRAQGRLQDKAVSLQSDLKQTDQLCQTMDAAQTLAVGQKTARLRIAQDQRQGIARTSVATNALDQLNSAHQASNANFCTDGEVSLGVCKPTAQKKYSNLAGADQNALYLFQSRSGGATYEGTKASGQVDAVDAYIARVVNGGLAPGVLSLGSPTAAAQAYEKTPQARAYVELARRYEAYLSMARYSLNSIKGSRTPAQ